jgi:hypothetical protein
VKAARLVQPGLSVSTLRIWYPATNTNEDLSPEASQILHIIRESAEPVGRANILSRTSVPAHKWTLAIQELKDQDYVVQHGSRRGAKYTIA